jgi:4-hydroxybenzoate polyprenyltransferase
MQGEFVRTLWGREPALILAAVQAVVALAVAFGLDLTAEQTGALLAVTAAVLGVVTRSQVSPTPPVPPKE